MDVRFSSDLQTALNLLGREGKFAPPKSQDPMDAAAHEMYVAGLIRSIGTKRYEIAKEYLLENVQQDVVNKTVEDAIKQDSMQTATLLSTEHYTAVLKAAKPVEYTDIKKFITELIKHGVDDVTIKQSLAESTLSREPAKTINVATTHARNGGK